jgi:hypothetical protein
MIIRVGSLETHPTLRDSLGNVIDYGGGEAPEIVMARGHAAKVKASLMEGGESREGSGSLMPDLGLM